MDDEMNDGYETRRYIGIESTVYKLPMKNPPNYPGGDAGAHGDRLSCLCAHPETH
jgi:hypothetical protein